MLGFTMAATDLEQRVAVVRRFNRFYTKQIGLLDDRFLHSPFSLTAARVLYELAQRDETTATELRRELGLDAGYLSRILRAFVQRRLIDRTPATRDARQSLVRLTAAGRRALDRKSTRLNSSHSQISYAVFCLKKKKAVGRRGWSSR